MGKATGVTWIDIDWKDREKGKEKKKKRKRNGTKTTFQRLMARSRRE